MSMTDPIADMLTRIRNALQAGHPQVAVPGSRIKTEIARILKEEGFISEFSTKQDDKQGQLSMELRYDPEKKGIILGIERVSKPGRRVYRGRDELPQVLNGLGVAVISTSQGVMTDAQARKRGVGGEVLCRVW
jgi:small subunit ribosomal protein S8